MDHPADGRGGFIGCRTLEQEWMKMDEAARQKWKPLVVHPSECTRLPQWHEEEEEATYGVVELEV